MRRSMLFLPGNTPRMLINGAFLGADAIIFDLEDAVAPAEKDAARILVRNTMRYMDLGGCEVIVRINSIDTGFWKADLDQILPEKPPHPPAQDRLRRRRAGGRRLHHGAGGQAGL